MVNLSLNLSFLEDYTILHHPKTKNPFNLGNDYLNFAMSRSILLVASTAGGMSLRPANFWRSDTSIPYSSDCKNQWNYTKSEKNRHWLLFPETYTAVRLSEITHLLLRNRKHDKLWRWASHNMKALLIFNLWQECLVFSTCSWTSLAETAGVWALTSVCIWFGLTAGLYTNIKCHFSH